MAVAQTLTINMGPQHPSTHGVLRVVLELEGETVLRAVPHIGYLHTGFEKESEYKSYNKALTLTDRLDYLACNSNNLAFVLPVEKLLELEIPRRAQQIRVMMCELGRLASHLAWLGTHALDMGAITPFFYCFREREMILDMFDMTAGARMTPSYIRVGGVAQDLPDGLMEKLEKFLKVFPGRIDEYEALLTKNKIWMMRTKGVGRITAEEGMNLGLTGPLLRACGVRWDTRKAQPYSGYEEYDFEIPVGSNGDVYDRYLVRVQEMRQSTRILEQFAQGLAPGPVTADAPKVAPPPRELLHRSMEALINHFIIFSRGYLVPAGEAYVPTESPKGELGFYFVSDGTEKPYRMHIRPPSFMNLQALNRMVQGRLVADVVAVIGSIDIILGEVDR
jgi:NADH-quinone oxidoreductase subunit D